MMVRLTRSELNAIEAMARHGFQKDAALAIGIEPQTLKNHLLAARIKTGSVSTVQLAYRLGAGELADQMPEDGDERHLAVRA